MTAEEFDDLSLTSLPRLVGQIQAICGNRAEAQDCVEACPASLAEQGAEVLVRPLSWVPAPTEVGTASFADIIVYRFGDDGESEVASPPYDWQTVGVAVAEDRVAVVVDRESTTEYSYELDPAGSAETGFLPYPQYPLLAAAALRLGDVDPVTGGPVQPEPSGLPAPALADFGSDDVTLLAEPVEEVAATPVSRCQGDVLEVLGAEQLEVLRVTSAESVSGAAVTMELVGAAATGVAWQTVQEWAEDRPQNLASVGLEVPQGPGDHEVEVEQGQARAISRQIPSDVPGGGIWLDLGLTRVGNRIGLVSYEAVDVEADPRAGRWSPRCRT